MALSYCEICGVLIPGGSSLSDDPEGVICDGCYDSRQVVLGDDSSDEAIPLDAPLEPVQFECVYCRSLLRLPGVASRIRGLLVGSLRGPAGGPLRQEHQKAANDREGRSALHLEERREALQAEAAVR